MGWDATTLRLVTKSLILVYITDTVFSTCKDLYLFIYSVQHDYVRSKASTEPESDSGAVTVPVASYPWFHPTDLFLFFILLYSLLSLILLLYLYILHHSTQFHTALYLVYSILSEPLFIWIKPMQVQYRNLHHYAHDVPKWVP